MDKNYIEKVIEKSAYSLATSEQLKKSIPDIIEALDSLSNNKDNKQSTKGDLFFLGDIHGNLPGALKAIYDMGFIDKKGDWQGNDNTLVQTGDVIDRGKFSLATILFFKVLKEQIAESVNNGKSGVGDLKLLVGNHEQYIARYGDSCSSDKPVYSKDDANAIVEVIEKETKRKNFDIMFASNQKNIIATHGEFSKQFLRSFATEYLKDDPDSLKKVMSTGGLSKNDIYKMLKEKGCTLEDIANHINNTLHKDGINGKNHFDIYQNIEYVGPKGEEDRDLLSKSEYKKGLSEGCKEIAEGQGIGWRKAKAIKTAIGFVTDLHDREITSADKPFVPVAVTAHTVLHDTLKKSGNDNSKEILSERFAPGKIASIHSNIYIDTNISDNRIAYLKVTNTNHVLAYESPDAGITFQSREIGNSSPQKEIKTKTKTNTDGNISKTKER